MRVAELSRVSEVVLLAKEEAVGPKLGRAYRETDLQRWRPINHRSAREKNAHDRLFDRVPIAASRRTISRSGDRGFEASLPLLPLQLRSRYRIVPGACISYKVHEMG